MCIRDSYKKSARQDFSLCIVEGEGVELEGTRWWFDKAGKPYSLQDIAALPMHRMALGNCAAAARPSCDYFAEGCCDPAKCMAVVCHAAGVTMPIMSPQNKGLVPTVTGMLGTILTRRRFIRSGEYVDCPHAQEDRIFPLPELSAEDAQKDYIPWPLPPMSKEEKKAQLRDQWKILLSVIGSGSRKF